METENTPPALAPVKPALTLLEMSADFDVIAKALADAQAEMEQPEKNRTAKVVSSRGSYEYHYADLAAVLNACKPLAKHGIAMVQFPENKNEEYAYTDDQGNPACAWRVTVAVTTKFLLGKQFLANRVEVVAESMAPQGIGKAETYCRRYGLQMLAGLAGEQDDDAGDGSDEKRFPAPEEGPRRASTGLAAGQQQLTVEILDIKSRQDAQKRWFYAIKIKGVADWIDANESQYNLAKRTKGTGVQVSAVFGKKPSGYLAMSSLDEVPPPGAIFASGKETAVVGS